MQLPAFLTIGLLFAAVTAAPLQQVQCNDGPVATETETTHVFTTVPFTKTVFLSAATDSPESTVQVHSSHRHRHTHKHVTHKPQTHTCEQAAPRITSTTHILVIVTVNDPSSTTILSTANNAASTPTTLATVVTQPVVSNPIPTTPTSTIEAAPTTPSTSSTLSTATSHPSSPSTAQPGKAAPSTTSTNGLTYGPAIGGTSFTNGELTWYATGLGACGLTSSPSDAIVAVSYETFDAYAAAAGGDPNKNPICGKTVTITGANGSEYTATVVDRCTGCAPDHLDLSQNFFNTVTDDANGVMHGVSWMFD